MFRSTAIAAAVAASLLLCACAGAPVAGPGHAPEPDESDDAVLAPADAYTLVPEAFLTPNTPVDNIDSPASWTDADGKTWLIATAKATDKLVVYDGDSGAPMRSVGGPGNGPGEFRRPNGIAVLDNRVYVVERDNQRVQVLSLPELEPLGTFGAAELRKPYGLWVRPLEDGAVEVLVSDNYMSPANDDVPPPLAELDERIKRYRLDGDALAGGEVSARLVGQFGDTGVDGAIRITESLWGDATHGRLLVAEEYVVDDGPATGTELRVYGLDGRFLGRNIGRDVFQAQAEGIALWQCGDGSGYWIATDQYDDRSVFHVFDRTSLAHLGAFAGETVANTDGVWLQQAATAGFPAGVFYAVNDDQGVGAFDWRDIADALELRVDCEASAQRP